MDLSYLLERVLEARDNSSNDFYLRYSRYERTLNMVSEKIYNEVENKKCLAMDEIELTNGIVNLVEVFDDVFYCNHNISDENRNMFDRIFVCY